MDNYKEIIKEKDERIAHLEKLLVELTVAQQQNAATIAEGYTSRSLSTPKEKPKSSLKTKGWKIILTIFVFLGIAGGVVWLFQSNISKQNSVTFVEQVQELSTLATIEAHMKTVIKEEDHKIFGKDIPFDFEVPGTKRELLLVVPGTVMAGVDLKGITSEDMVINEETKEIDITLPPAKFLQEPSVQIDKIQAIDKNGLLRADIKMNEGFNKLAEAQKQMKEEAKSINLLNDAEKNAEKALKEFFRNICYTVNITFN